MSDSTQTLQEFITATRRKHSAVVDGAELTSRGISFVLEKPERCLLILDPNGDDHLNEFLDQVDCYPEQIDVRHAAFAGADTERSVDVVIRTALGLQANGSTVYLEYKHRRYWRRKPRREWIFVTGLASILSVFSEDELYWRIEMFVSHLVWIGQLGHRGILHIGLENVPVAMIARLLADHGELLQNVEILEGA